MHDGYLEENKKSFLVRKHVLEIYAKYFCILNKIAVSTKQQLFNHYKMKVLEGLQFEQEIVYMN